MINPPSFWAHLGTGIQYLGLALIIGGVLALGAFSAPVLFKSLAREEAGDIMTIIFLRYDKVILVSLGLIVIGEVLRLMYTGFPLLQPLVVSRYVVLVALVGMSLFTTLILNPKLDELQKHPEFSTNLTVREKFNNAHKWSEKLVKTQLVAGIILLLLTPFIPSTKIQ